MPKKKVGRPIEFTIEDLNNAIREGARTNAEMAARMGCCVATVTKLKRDHRGEVLPAPLPRTARAHRTEAARLFRNYTVEEIAEHLEVTARTVRRHLVELGLLPPADNEAQRKRDLVVRLWRGTDLEQTAIADVVGVHKVTVSRIVTGMARPTG